MSFRGTSAPAARSNDTPRRPECSDQVRQNIRSLARTVAAAVIFAAVVVASVTAASPGTARGASEGCADVEVVFARGTFEAPGIGATGQGFVDALRSRAGNRIVDVYPVNYPASLDFARAADGVIDAGNRIRATAERCSDTDIIVGGYSQGAAVNAYAISDGVPVGYALPAGLTGPMPTAVADHVSAVVLFGRPSPFVARLAVSDAPPQSIAPAYQGKTLDLCAPRDPICVAGGLDRNAHSAYLVNGMTEQAADFAVQRLRG